MVRLFLLAQLFECALISSVSVAIATWLQTHTDHADRLALASACLCSASYCLSVMAYRRAGTYLNFESLRYFLRSSRQLLLHQKSLERNSNGRLRDSSLITVAAGAPVLCCWLLDASGLIALSLLTLLFSAMVTALWNAPFLSADRVAQLAPPSEIKVLKSLVSYHAGPVSNFLLYWNYRLNLKRALG